MNMKMTKAAIAYSFLIAAIAFVGKHICPGTNIFLSSCWVIILLKYIITYTSAEDTDEITQ